MNPGCDSLKKRRYAARLAAIYADQASVPNEVCHFNILSINRVHEVSGHFTLFWTRMIPSIEKTRLVAGTNVLSFIRGCFIPVVILLEFLFFERIGLSANPSSAV